MGRLEVEEASEVSVTADAVERLPERASADNELLAEVRRLELELERYRAHAERTSKLFLSATKYAEWVRENARHDAELALRKARAKVERLEATTKALEHAEHELERRYDELAHIRGLIEETRAQLSSFLAAGLRALDADVQAEGANGPPTSLGDLPDALHRQLAPTAASPPGEPPGGPETQER